MARILHHPGHYFGRPAQLWRGLHHPELILGIHHLSRIGPLVQSRVVYLAGGQNPQAPRRQACVL